VIGDESVLRGLGVRDSKKLTPGSRVRLFRELTHLLDHWSYLVIEPPIVDQYVARRGLNLLEAEAMARLIIDAMSKLRIQRIYIDSPDPVPSRFSRIVESLVNAEAELIAMNKADEEVPVVSAASIIAKVIRDILISELRRIYGDFGSGYPSDPRTREFLRKHKDDLPPIVRKSWSTLRRIKWA